MKTDKLKEKKTIKCYIYGLRAYLNFSFIKGKDLNSFTNFILIQNSGWS